MDHKQEDRWTNAWTDDVLTVEEDVNGHLSGARAADESVTLRGHPSDMSKTGAWKAAPFIFVAEFGETVGHLSIALNLITYLILNLHQTSDKSSTIFTNFMGTCFLTSVGWGFVADSYLGRFWTIVSGFVIMLSGLGLITLSTALPALKPPPCTPTLTQPCPVAEGRVMSAFYGGIYLIAIGAGGIKPCVPPLGGDQFDDSVPAEKKKRPLYFNLLFWSLQIGVLFVLTGIVYIQDNLGRTKGFGIPTAIFLGSFIIFYAGTPFYRHKRPAGSAFTRIAQVFVAAARKSRHVSHTPNDDGTTHLELYEISPSEAAATGRTLAHTDDFRFLDKAAVIADGEIGKDGTPSSSRWKLCPVTQVEEAKRVVHVLPIWLTTIVPYILFAQVSTYSVIQSLSMNRHIGSSFQVPAASFQAFSLVVTCTLLPLYDPVFVPFMRRLTGHPKGLSPLHRIGTGLAVSITSMLSSALVEYHRRRVAKAAGLLDNPMAQLPISAFYLVPQIGILGLTEVFLTVGQIEFFYEEMPDGMRSLGTALYCSAIAIGYYITSFLVPTVIRLTRDERRGYGGWLAPNINRGDLQNFYWLLVALSVANLAFFLLAAHLYKYKRLDSGVRLGAARHDARDAGVDSSVSSRPSAARPSDAQLLDHSRYVNSTANFHR